MDGPIKEWNRMHPDNQVRVGDRITFVNGKRKKDVLSEILKYGCLAMTLKRGRSAYHSMEDVMSREMVDRLPCVMWTAPQDGDFEESCRICLDNFENGDVLLKL